MPYEEEKISIPKSTTIPKSEREKLQKEFTLSKVADLQSVLNKLHRQFKQGLMNLETYEQKRKDVFKLFAISREDRIKFLGAKFAS